MFRGGKGRCTASGGGLALPARWKCCSLEEGTQCQSKEACCIGRLNVGVSEGWSKVHLSMVCAERGKRCELCGESDRCQEVVGDVDPEEVCGDLEEMGSVDLVI